MIGVNSLVVCVDNRPAICPCCRAWNACALRSVWRVVGISRTRLILDGADGHAFPASRFRPLNDSHDDVKLIEQIKSCKPQLAERASLKLAAWNGGAR